MRSAVATYLGPAWLHHNPEQSQFNTPFSSLHYQDIGGNCLALTRLLQQRGMAPLLSSSRSNSQRGPAARRAQSGHLSQVQPRGAHQGGQRRHEGMEAIDQMLLSLTVRITLLEKKPFLSLVLVLTSHMLPSFSQLLFPWRRNRRCPPLLPEMPPRNRSLPGSY